MQKSLLIFELLARKRRSFRMGVSPSQQPVDELARG
jgi:hypothetical protein